MSQKQDWLEFWGYALGTPEAEEAWQQKVDFDNGKRLYYAPLVFVRGDVHYESPIDGRHITSMDAHRDDLARNNCIAYDPEMKTDAARRRAEAEANLDKAIETHVEKEIHQMPSFKKERLVNELSAGLTVEPVRLTAKGG